MARLKAKISQNLNAFLDMLSYAEGTSTSPITQDDGYDIIVTGVDGRERFTDYSTHPFARGRKSKLINGKRNLYSNASGRYQHMLKDWAHYRDLLKLPDFGPESQDRWAIQLIKETGALPYIEKGKFLEAIERVRHLWASLPGAGYNQPERTITAVQRVYLANGGTLWNYSAELPVTSLRPSAPLAQSLLSGSVQNTLDEKKESLPNLSSKIKELLLRITKFFKSKRKL